MRKLSELEKKVAKVLFNHPHVTEQGMVQLASVIDKDFVGESQGISIALLLNENKVAISVPEKEVDKLREKFILVISIFNFLEYLNKEGLIIFVGEEKTQGALGNQYKDGQTTFLPFPLSTFVLENFTKYILITEEFKDIVNSNFKDYEQTRHQHTLIISVIALTVSISLGLYGVFSNQSNGTISDERYDQINSSINEITNKIESAIIELKVKPDYLVPLNELDIKLEAISKEVALISKTYIVVNSTDDQISE